MPVERIVPPSDGVNTEASLLRVPTTQGRRIENMLVRDGMLRLRGPFETKYTLGAASNAARQKVWTSDNKVLIYTDAHYVVDVAAGTTTSVTPAKTLESSRHARVGDVVYGAITPTSGATRDMGVWTPSASTVAAVANAPVDFIDVKHHLTRLFVLGGSVPGTTTPVKPFNLYWSDQLGPTAGTLAQWQDDVSGLTNQLTYTQLDSPVALARCGNNLAILMRRSIYLLTGTGTSSFSTRLLTSEFGCLDRETVSESADGFWFMSDRGLCFCDTAGSIQVVSGSVQKDLLESLFAARYDVTALPSGHVMLGKTLGSGAGVAAWIFDTSRRAWSTLTSTALFDIPNAAYRLKDHTVYYDGKNLWKGTAVSQPEGASGVYDTGAISVVPTYYTRTARLSSPEFVSTITRFTVDYLSMDGTANPTCTLVDGLGNTLKTVSLPTSLTRVLQRFQADVFAEASEVSLRFTQTTGSTFEIYDVSVEYKPGPVMSSR